MTTPPREGPRPSTDDSGPHSQLDQQAPPELWGRLVAEVLALPGVEEGISQVSPVSSRAVLLTDLPDERSPETSLAPGRRLEPVHLHGVGDTSLHLCLPVARGRELTALGWAEAHRFAVHETELMVYGPRTPAELQVVLGLVEESLAFARGGRDAPPAGDPEPEPEPIPHDDDRPPIHSARGTAVDWLQRPEYRAAALAEQIAFSVVYSWQGYAPGQEELREWWPTGAQLSWLGGPAAGVALEDWPRSRAGTPLAHVATFDLRHAHDSIDAVTRHHWPEGSEGLPDHGILQVFHDLVETYGDEPEDGDAGGWLVQWLPEPDRALLVDGPPDLDPPTDACQVVMPWGSWSVPGAEDAIAAPTPVFEATEAAERQIQRMWHWQHTLDRAAPPVPVTHLYGHAQHGALVPRMRILPACLPLTEPDDAYRLLLEVESWTILTGWFGGVGTLQVWMRESDLRDRRFDRAWCIVRNG